MGGVHLNNASRVAMLYTRYPVVSETFLQREAAALKRAGLECDLLSLWPAPGKVDCEVQADDVFRPWHLPALFFWIPYWLVCNPRGMVAIAEVLVRGRRTNLLNFWESMLGMGYGILRAKVFTRKYGHVHAVWSSAPGTAAWAIYQLTGLRYSMAGHAYDLFEDGGDGLLAEKFPHATFLRTSTGAGRQRWMDLGAEADRIHVIRRGLTRLPVIEESPVVGNPPRLLAIGRLVEKMGFDLYLEILRELKNSGFPFQATLIGGGPLLNAIDRRATDFGIRGQLSLTGALPYREVEPYYQGADLFLFTGKIARSGDRAGFPNVIGEAMAWGVPVAATPVGAVTEGIRDGQTGLVFQSPAEASRKIRALFENPEQYGIIRAAARKWVEEAFDANRNMLRLKELLDASCGKVAKAHPQSHPSAFGN